MPPKNRKRKQSPEKKIQETPSHQENDDKKHTIVRQKSNRYIQECHISLRQLTEIPEVLFSLIT
jgi:hypothetical protein